MALSEQQIKCLDVDEILDIIVEESAEVIQAAQKVRRFGALNGHEDYYQGMKNYMAVIIEGGQLERVLRRYASYYGEMLSNPALQNVLSDADFVRAYPNAAAKLQMLQGLEK